MSKVQSGGIGVAGGLLLVIVIIICGAFLGYKGREAPEPAPTSDRPPIIVDQK
jgi:hypothetical protein